MEEMEWNHIENTTYSFIMPFEEAFDGIAAQDWMKRNWLNSVTLTSVAYLLFVFGGQSVMVKRSPFNLRGLLTVWNLFLAVFSIIALARTLPEFLHTTTQYGFYYSVCSPSFLYQDKVSGFWTLMGVLSKLFELGDTVFIVLRKQKLIFLHWYHHVTVLIFCWYSYTEFAAPTRWFMVINFLCHSFMYSYYALKSLRFPVPKGIAMVITSLQLSQMIVGSFLTYFVFKIKSVGQACNVSDTQLLMSLVMYISYALLFTRFFYGAYFKSGSERKGDKVK